VDPTVRGHETTAGVPNAMPTLNSGHQVAKHGILTEAAGLVLVSDIIDTRRFALFGLHSSSLLVPPAGAPIPIREATSW